MNKKNKKIIAIAAVVLAVVIAAMGLVYHFFGPQTKLDKPVETTAEVTTVIDEETQAQETDAQMTEAQTEAQTQKAPDKKPAKPSKPVKPAKPAEPATKAPVKPTTPATEAQTEKQGISLTIEVVFADGSKKTHEIKTNANNLGDALVENNIVKGEKSQYGLFITEVDGVKADDSKQQWWMLTKNGEMTPTGADTTPIANGDKFELTLKTGYDM